MNIPDDWQTYRSEFGLYTVRLPPDWTILGGIADGGQRGGQFGPMTLTYEGHTFFHDNDFYVFIGTFKFNSLVDRKTYASDKWGQTYHGYPAMLDMLGRGGWEFITADCYFHCSIHIVVPDPERQSIADMIFDSLTPANPAQLVMPEGEIEPGGYQL